MKTKTITYSTKDFESEDDVKSVFLNAFKDIKHDIYPIRKNNNFEMPLPAMAEPEIARLIVKILNKSKPDTISTSNTCSINELKKFGIHITSVEYKNHLHSYCIEVVTKSENFESLNCNDTPVRLNYSELIKSYVNKLAEALCNNLKVNYEFGGSKTSIKNSLISSSKCSQLSDAEKDGIVTNQSMQCKLFLAY